MNILLIIAGVILLYSVVDGYKKGMVRSIISFISLIILCIVVALVGNGLRSYFDGEILNVVIMVLLLCVVAIVHHLLNVLFFPAKLITKLPIVKSLDKILGILVGVLETVLILWTVYTFVVILNMGVIGQLLLEYTEESPVLLWFYQNNYLAYWVQQLGTQFHIL